MSIATEIQARSAKRVLVPRQWIGAPDTAWNPTLTLMVVVVIGLVTGIGGLASGVFSPWIAVPLLAVGYYMIFTVLHESMHGIAHRNRALNTALGRVAGFALMLPLPVFRAVHLAHHSHTNDPVRDPDMIVARRPVWFRPVWFMLTPFHYRGMVYGGGGLRNRSAVIEAACTETAIVGVMVACVATGHGILLVQAWALPSVLAILWLALTFDLLPHLPHTTRERYYDTRIYPGRLLNALLLGQNYHLIHHLWTTIPWYHYEQAFHEVRDDLIARRAPVGWRSRAVLP